MRARSASAAGCARSCCHKPHGLVHMPLPMRAPALFPPNTTLGVPRAWCVFWPHCIARHCATRKPPHHTLAAGCRVSPPAAGFKTAVNPCCHQSRRWAPRPQSAALARRPGAAPHPGRTVLARHCPFTRPLRTRAVCAIRPPPQGGPEPAAGPIPLCSASRHGAGCTRCGQRPPRLLPRARARARASPCAVPPPTQDTNSRRPPPPRARPHAARGALPRTFGIHTPFFAPWLAAGHPTKQPLRVRASNLTRLWFQLPPKPLALPY